MLSSINYGMNTKKNTKLTGIKLKLQTIKILLNPRIENYDYAAVYVETVAHLCCKYINKKKNRGWAGSVVLFKNP